VKRIRLAQDVINSAEESVYDTLWNAKLIATDERDASRLVQAGYDYLVKRTRLSRKTIQRIVAKLLEKDFIAVETRADIYERTATIYRVFSYKSVLEMNAKKGRLYVAKMGPGFSYARPIDDAQTHMTIVDTPHASPMVNTATIAKPAIVGMVKTDRPTVVKMSPYLLDSRVLDKTSSSGAVRAALASYGRADDDVAAQLVAACRSYAPDCTEDEIVHFIHEKGTHVQRRDSRIINPLGFLLTAVPKCFSGELLNEYRAEQGREGTAPATLPETEDPALLRWRREQQAALSDPSVSEQEKHLIRLCLGLNTS
jgi:predicted transcriptional regulator